MKKFFKIGCLGFIVLIVLGIIVGAMSGGSDVPDTTTDTTATAPDSTEPATDAPKEEAPKEEAPKEEAPKLTQIGEPLKVGDVVYTVHGRSEADNVGGEYGENATGKFLVLDVAVKNEGKESLLVDSSLFKLTSGDVTYEASGTASMYANEQADFFLSDLNPSLELKGKVVFDLPAEAHTSDLTLVVQTGLFGTETGQIALQ